MITFSVKTCDGKDYQLFFTAGHWRVCYGNTGQPFHGQRIYDTVMEARE